VANAGLKVADFSVSCEETVRVTSKELSGGRGAGKNREEGKAEAAQADAGPIITSDVTIEVNRMSREIDM
jgi:hypothetical protein